MKNKFSFAMTLALIMSMLFNSLALADTVTSDVVLVTAGNQSVINLGTVAPGQVINSATSFQLVCNGNNHADQGNTVTVQYQTATIPSDGALTAGNATIGPIPAAWVDDAGGPGNCPIPTPVLDDNGNSGVTITAPTAAGTHDFVVTYKVATSGGIDSNDITGSIPAVTFRLTVLSDTTAPIITKTITGTVGNNGWYTSNVVVDWTVTDAESSFTTTGCADTTISSDTAGVTSSCSATSAGGTASDSVTIKRDATAPSISGSASPAPNGAGWNNTDVNVTFSCSDATAGVASCGSNQTLASNGADQSATGNAVDNAGNSASATVSNIDIDKELPSITSSIPAANGNGWYNGPVTASFVCDDEFSGVDFCEPDHTFSGEGSGQSYTGHASDVADNENSSNVSVNIDTTAPVIALISRTPANGNGWNNGNVDLEWSCTDGGSGVVEASVFASVTTEGENQSATGTCEDLAGNAASDEQTGINIDKTAPSISAQRDTLANANGWNNTDVASSYSASDALSGLDSAATGSFTFSLEGAGQSRIFTVTDLAGNSASASVENVNIDKTAPTISGATDRAPNSNGWYDADVTVSFTCADGLSGLDTCSDPYILGEGENQSVIGTASDLAGNSATATVSDINIDKTAPSASADAAPTANSNGWNNTDVTVSFTGTDALSGIDACDTAVVLSSDGAGQSASGTCTDLAGNVSAPATASGINIDKTAPTASASALPAANSNGWNNTDVTVSFTGTDALSGIDACDTAVVLSSEGAGQSASGTCTDLAGNVSAPATASGINLDKTAPIVSLVGGPANGGTYYFGFVPAAPTCSASDALSGLDGTCSVSGYNASTGSHTVTSSAMDKAGNSASASASYAVLNWTLNGFYQPVDMNGVFNVVRNGSTVPLKFEIFAGTTELTLTNHVQSLTYAQVTCNATSPTDEVETVATGGTVLRYDTTGGQFIFNWKTPANSGKCYRVTMTTLDGSSLVAFFKLK